MLYKRGVLKNFSIYTVKHKKRSSGAVLSKVALKDFPNFSENIFTGVSFYQSFKLETWNCQKQPLEMFRKKKPFLKILEISQENTCVAFLFNEVAFWGPAFLLKNTPMQVLSCKISQIFKNSYIEEHLWISACNLDLKGDSNTNVFHWIL